MSEGHRILFAPYWESPRFTKSGNRSSVGIVEAVKRSRDLEEVIRLTAKRSVFSADELSRMIEERDTPLKIIDFLLIGHLEPIIPLDQLIHEGIVRGVPQSISRLSPLQYSRLKPLVNLGFSF